MKHTVWEHFQLCINITFVWFGQACFECLLCCFMQCVFLPSTAGSNSEPSLVTHKNILEQDTQKWDFVCFVKCFQTVCRQMIPTLKCYSLHSCWLVWSMFRPWEPMFRLTMVLIQDLLKLQCKWCSMNNSGMDRNRWTTYAILSFTDLQIMSWQTAESQFTWVRETNDFTPACYPHTGYTRMIWEVWIVCVCACVCGWMIVLS